MATAKAKPAVKPQRYTSWLQINVALAALATARAEHERLNAKLDERLAAAQTAIGEDAESKALEVQSIEQGIEAFLHERKQELMGEEGNRTLQLENGKVGLRWGPPKLVTMSKVTFEKVLERALSLPAGLRRLFVRDDPSLDKKALLKAIREEAIPDTVRRELGVDAWQEEYAVIEPA